MNIGFNCAKDARWSGHMFYQQLIDLFMDSVYIYTPHTNDTYYSAVDTI